MPATFNPAEKRESFRRFRLDFELNNDPARYLPTGVGNAATHGLDAVVFAWLTGQAGEIAPALAKYRDWLSDSIRRNERFGDAPEFAAAERAQAYALALWMLDNRNQDVFYREALDHLENAWRDNWANGRPATHQQILTGSIADYLANCLQCGEFERGIEMYERLGGSTNFTNPRAKVAGEFGYWACRQRANQSFSVDKYVDMGSRYLVGNLESNWLAHGLGRTAATWLKIVFWHTEACTDPLSTILKAYEVMPHVSRPDFV